MWKFLLGPILLGTICIAGSIFGADATQIVHKPPSVVREAVTQAITNAASGTIPLEGGKPLAYELRREWLYDDEMVVTIMMTGEQGAVTRLRFTPQDDGKATLVTAKIHTEHPVMRRALAGSSKAKLGYAPDWVFNLTFRPSMKKFAEQIEGGGAVGDPTQGFQSQADWQAGLSPDEQRRLEEWQQYDASRPMVDPNEAAQSPAEAGGGVNP
jgi:hypothetical protein